MPEQLLVLRPLVKWLCLAGVVGVLSGSASALFLASLDWVTHWREAHPRVIWFLPLTGFVIGWLFLRFGASVERGNNLIIDEIHSPKAVIPLRMTPLVLLGTLATHLVGGSAGREGTAVQMGGSLADQLTGPLRLKPENRRILLMAGMSGGFASVFGTPLAGAVFGLEVLTVGRMRYEALLPCFVAAIVGHEVTLLWGIAHTVYPLGAVPPMGLLGLGLSLLCGALFGVVGALFAKGTHRLGAWMRERIAVAPLRPALGGVVILAAVLALGSTDYIGLGIPVIVRSFESPAAPWEFAIKALLTVVTLGSGFKGGEVTPLFFIGATLGSALGMVIPLPFPLLAAMGFVAVFGGAANTPIAATLIGLELFGPEAGLYIGVASVASYLFSGDTGIYHSQKISEPKALS